MPDTKLTLANLREHLRKHLAVYVAVVIAALVVSNLLWTVTAPRASSRQSLVIYMADAFSDPEPLSPIAAHMLARAQEVDEGLREVRFESLTYTGGEVDITGTMLLMTRLSMNEGDAFLASADAMEALANAGGLMPLDEYYADGWLEGFPLTPWYVTLEDDETGGQLTQLAGFHLDAIDGLRAIGAFDNQGACLAIAAGSDNPEAARAAMEVMLADLIDIATEADHDRAEG